MGISDMKRHSRPLLVATLLACFLFVSVGLSGQAVDHTLHHAHHKAATHASLLCSWVCSAGNVLQAFQFDLHGPFLTFVFIEPKHFSAADVAVAWAPSSRAPPLSPSMF